MYNFEPIRDQFKEMRRRHPKHGKDITKFQNTVEQHIRNYGSLLVLHRQSRKKTYLDQAEKEVEKVQKIMNQVSKWELMSLLSKDSNSG